MKERWVKKMAEVKWIKMATDIFDNRKIRQIECLPDGDAIIVIWVKLLCLAGSINDSGMIYFTKEIPYTDQMLATQFNRPMATIKLALTTFEQFGMVEVIDNILCISNWEKYQNVEGMERIREQNRIRQKNWYDRQKALPNVRPNVSITSPNATDIDIEEEKEEERRIRIDYTAVAELFNRLCPSFPEIRSMSDARKKAIKARLNNYTIEDFEELFKKAEASDFLKGKNGNNWSATFDWLIKDANMAKVLDGNYDNRKQTTQPSRNDKAQELDDFYAMASAWAQGGE